jgi:hypothetical protein
VGHCITLFRQSHPFPSWRSEWLELKNTLLNAEVLLELCGSGGGTSVKLACWLSDVVERSQPAEDKPTLE